MMTLDTPAARLKYVREKVAKLTRAQIEADYKMPAATLKAWENEINPMTDKGIQRCIELYRKVGIQLTREWLLEGRGVEPKTILTINQYLAGDPHFVVREDTQDYIQRTDRHARQGIQATELQASEFGDDVGMLQEARYFKASYPDAVIFLVNSDEMAPSFLSGDYVGGRFRYGEQIKTADQEMCIIRLQSGETLFRHLHCVDDGQYYNLACTNPRIKHEQPVIFQAEVECVAPIIWHRRPEPQ